MSRLAEALSKLEQAGIEVVRGTPASDDDVAKLQKKVGCALPPDYVAFLEELGALHVADRLTVFGHSDDASLRVTDAAKTIAAEFEQWHQDPSVVCPFYATQHFPSECLVFDPKGAVQSFWRGRLESRTESFEEVVVGALERELSDHEEGAAKAGANREVLERLFHIVPRELLATPDADPRSIARLVLRRPSDGVDIEIRFGDGREYHGATPGLFVFWTQPATTSIEDMNAWNQRALLARGAVQEGRDRYRGLIPAAGLDLQAFLDVLAAEAGLALESARSRGSVARASLDDVEKALQGDAALSSTKRLARTLARAAMRRRAHASHGEPPEPPPPRLPRDGDVLIAPCPSRDSGADPIELRIGVTGEGLVRVSHGVETTLDRADLLVLANEHNGAALSDHDVNFDMEPMIRASVDGTRMVFSFVMTHAAFETGAYAHTAQDLATAVGKSGLLAPPDLGAKRAPALERLVDVPVGPVSRALLGSLPFTGSRISLSFGFEPGWDKAVDTPWGSVTPFLRVQDSHFAGYTPIEVGLAAKSGATSDQCRVVGLRGSEAVLLAADLASFIPVLVMGTTGFASDCSDERAWRSYRDLCSDEADLGEHFFEAGRRLCRKLGLDAGASVTAMLERAGSPRRAEVKRG